MKLENKIIHVVGISGMEGWAAAKFLIGKGAKVIGHDFTDQADIKQNFYNLRDYLNHRQKEREWGKFDNLDIEINYKDEYLKGIDEADMIFLPQSWFRYDFNNPIKKIKEKVKTIGILDLYIRFTKAKVVGITGSNGKSTTSQLVYRIIKNNRKTLLSGNDRESLPVLDKVESLRGEDCLVLEISNRQLIDFDLSVDIGLITNIFPTHLDDHGSYENYKQAKANLIANQTPDQKAIINQDDSNSAYLKNIGKGDKYLFSRNQEVAKGCYLKEGRVYFSGQREPVFEVSKLKVPGSHNQENALGAACAAKLMEIDNEDISRALYSFKGSKHRLEYVGEIEGASYYNDSQSTNPGSTVVGIRSFDSPVIIIVGGKAKPNLKDYQVLLDEIKQNKNIKKVLLIGEAGHQLVGLNDKDPILQELMVNCNKLKEAMIEAKSITESGDIVLMSPGAESFGEFRDYRHRGERFKELFKELKNND